MSSSSEYMNGMTSGFKKGKAGGESIEKIYQKKSQLEHILLRPDTYIGSVEPVAELMWLYNNESQCMEQRQITYVPGLYKIYDEILVNAADNKQRDSKMDCIKITIDPEKNVISVWNNGQGIPVVEHKDEKMYVPTMIFGHLLTSSNYNDEEQKVTGGRNGFGAKLCNIFSTKFTVETASKEYKRKFKQTWSNNMSNSTDPIIEDSFHDWTKVTFSPDLAKFGMTNLDKDIVDLMSRRAYDVCASTRGVKVYLNGERLPVKDFKDYVNLFLKNAKGDDEEPLKVAYDNPNARWEIAVTVSEKGFQQMSFVNSIATTKGGRHVDYVTDQLVKHLIETMKKKNKGGVQIKPFQIKTHLWVFVNCLIVNPTFDSQTKETMTLQCKNFGSKCVISDKFVNTLLKTGVVENILMWAKFKADAMLAAKSGGKKKNKLRGLPKLEDANDAGTKNSIDCTLILTEGDSAKSLAVSGLGVVGRDKYGVFPLRGKLLNVREASHKQILENAEINNLVKIIGLQYKKKYETIDDIRTLRYGRLMIMTDQDQDGSHIKGLIINFIHHNWPSLLKMNFLEEFITPIIKATRGREELSFYSIPEFLEWQAVNDPQNRLYRIKYYKGLGTSTSKEAKEYFQNLQRHRILFDRKGDEDDKSIVMAFSKKQIEARKEWLINWMARSKERKELGLNDEYLYEKDTRVITYEEFINKELVLFSNMDNERSIPSMMDGLKPGSRKVIFTCLKRNKRGEMKVAQLAGAVGECSAYHHGEQSLTTTIVNLAQNFVGSNNINLLQPRGQFGTRLQGGKDAASARYIFTMLSPLTRLIFHKDDDPLLHYLTDDNKSIEPDFYVPIIPMVLVNGADGIGTGWMTKIPNHNPREIIENLKRMIRGEEPRPMKPWYKNFRGEIEAVGDKRFVTSGEVALLGETQLEITELPIGTWTQAYKEGVLEPMLHGGEKTPSIVTDYKEYNTDTTVKFQVYMPRDKLDKATREGALHRIFKLQSSITLTSMCAFDKDSVLRRYDSSLQILKEFYDVRLHYYAKRKEYMEGLLQAEANKLSNQARFIVEKCDGVLVVENRKRKDMLAELMKRKYDPDPEMKWKLEQKKKMGAVDESDEEIGEEEEEGEGGSGSSSKPGKPKEEKEDSDFDYLLGMKFWSVTLERKEALLRQRDEKFHILHELQKKTPSDLWIADLNALMEKLDEVERKEREEEMQAVKKFAAGGGGGGRSAKTAKKKSVAEDNLPSKHGERIMPRIDDEMKIKVEKAEKAKREKVVEYDENGEVIEKPKRVRKAVTPKVKGEKKKRKMSSGEESGSDTEKKDVKKNNKKQKVAAGGGGAAKKASPAGGKKGGGGGRKGKVAEDSAGESEGGEEEMEMRSEIKAAVGRRSCPKLQKGGYVFSDSEEGGKSDGSDSSFDIHAEKKIKGKPSGSAKKAPGKKGKKKAAFSDSD